MKDFVVGCDFDTGELRFSYAVPSDVPHWPSGEMWISIVPKGFINPKVLSFWERVKIAFNFIIKGYTYETQVVLGKNKVVELKNWLNSLDGLN